MPIGKRLAAMLPLLPLLAAAAPAPIGLPGDRLFPESISISNGIAYVGSMSGGVLRVTLATGRSEPFVKPGAFGSGALFGVLADPRNHMLWTCTNDFSRAGLIVPGAEPGHFVKGFDLRTGAGRISMALPGDHPTCNDFAVGRDGSLYVTDTGNPRILRWTPGSKTLEIWLEDGASFGVPPQRGALDGLAFGGDGNLYVNTVHGNELFRVELRRDGRPGKVTRLETSRSLASPDGMRPIGGLSFALAEGKGKVDRIDVSGDRAEVTTLAEGIDQPTGVDVDKGVIWYSQGQLSGIFSPEKGGPDLPFRLTPIAKTAPAHR